MAVPDVSQAVDVVGFNYQQNEYDRFHAANPGLPMLSSEDTSSFWLDGHLLGRKDDAAPSEFSLALPPAEGERELSVLIESPTGSALGFVSAMIDSKETGK